MTETAIIFAVTGVAVFGIGLFGLIARTHLLRRIIAVNVMAGGIFIFFGAMAERAGTEAGSDPVPHAMVITGIVVAVSVTAFAIALARRIHVQTGRSRLPRERER